MVDFYGKNIGKYTVRPMDPMGSLIFQVLEILGLVQEVVFKQDPRSRGVPVGACLAGSVDVSPEGSTMSDWNGSDFPDPSLGTRPPPSIIIPD